MQIKANWLQINSLFFLFICITLAWPSGNQRAQCNYTYRSPLIMRNEKTAMPAPPEYTRQAFLEKKNSHTGILNELQMMLQQDIPMALVESPDECASLINNTNTSNVGSLASSPQLTSQLKSRELAAARKIHSLANEHLNNEKNSYFKAKTSNDLPTSRQNGGLIPQASQAK